MNDLVRLKKYTKDLHVLYVEDDQTIRAKMEIYLQKLFASVSIAEDGVEGLKKFNETKFDLVITDLSMPHMGGLEMIEKIKEIYEHQPILITTAHSESEYLFAAIKLGIDGYIIKPFDYNQLNQELFKSAFKIYRFHENEEYKEHLNQLVEEKTSALNSLLQYQSANYDKTLYSMVDMIESRDTYTAGHSQRVAYYSKLIAESIPLNPDDVTLLYQAGMLHDIGKIGTPDAILLNPKHLSEIEYKLIQEHVEGSFQILKNIPMFEEMAEIVRSHHERYDGTGYPRGLQGDEIGLLSHIMIIADAFDAMTTNRIYKARKSVKDALAEIESLSGKQFHPDVVPHAISAFKDLNIDTQINQLPTSKLEEERFAYFYKDRLSEAYNQSYLDVVLMNNSYEKKFKHLDLFCIRNFSNYNKLYGWKAGDQVLHDFGKLLLDNLEDVLVFRILGDDFVVMSEVGVPLEELKKKLDSFVIAKGIDYALNSIDLDKYTIDNLAHIEEIQKIYALENE